MERELNPAHFSVFYQYLKEDERESSTIQKYLQDVKAFSTWLLQYCLNEHLFRRAVKAVS